MNRNLPKVASALGMLLLVSALFNGYMVFRQALLRDQIARANATLASEPRLPDFVRTAPDVLNLYRALLDDVHAFGQKQPAAKQILMKYTAPAAPPG